MCNPQKKSPIRVRGKNQKKIFLGVTGVTINSVSTETRTKTDVTPGDGSGGYKGVTGGYKFRETEFLEVTNG